MALQRKRVKPGDVLELKEPEGFAYLQYVGKHPEYGDTVLVSRKLGDRQTAMADEIFSSGYIAFYPVAAAVAQRIAEVVGHLPPPSLPHRVRRPGARYGRGVYTWIIENDAKVVVKSELSEDELRLPIAVIWNHELLVQRIRENWDPVQEGRGL